MEIIRVQNLSMAYEGVPVFNNLSFGINKGEILFILGSNGAGKTTLVKGILGTQKPQSGKIQLCGVTKRDIGYLSQDESGRKDFPASVQEIVLSGRIGSKKGLPFYNKADRKAAALSLETLGIKELANKSFNELSGGQKQRVLIARALTAAEKVLILDEPTKGLDASATQELYNTIYELNRNGEMTIIVVSHDSLAASKYATNIIRMPKEEE